MRPKYLLSGMSWMLTATLLLSLVVQSARAGTTYKVLQQFYSNADFPVAGLTLDTAGNLYGTTSLGGKPNCPPVSGCGAVFELERSAKGWSYKVIHEFNGSDGGSPFAGVTLDAAGNIYGTTLSWGAYGYGTVFELMPTPGHRWKEKVLYSFQGPEGASPEGELIFDAQGNLYGTTAFTYGSFGGSVFKLAPGMNGQWTESTLAVFSSPGPIFPTGSLVFDSAGNLFGTTLFGGSSMSDGVVFELTPQPNGEWVETILYEFLGGSDGAVPNGGLVLDAAGNLYGTTRAGATKACGYQGCGAVFELTPSSGNWTEKLLYVFCSVRKCHDGAVPVGGLAFDTRGNLYGTTVGGGNSGCRGGCGTVFKLSPNMKGSWTEKVIHGFTLGITNGLAPLAGVVFDSAGHLYGTTEYGGNLSCFSEGCGVVFEMTP